MLLARQGWALARPFARRHKRELGVLLAILAVLLGPFILRPASGNAATRHDRRLVIMTPHHESIRREFGQAFAKQWKEKTSETLYIDWRVAGTAELRMMVASDFVSAFEYYWRRTLNKSWSDEIGREFLNPKAAADSEARAEFMKSKVGIGVDVFFGGGAYDFEKLAAAGFLVASDPATGAGLARLKERHPEWFNDESLPAKVGGETYYDPSLRWCGTALSSFGIVYNRDVLKRLGIEKEPEHWSDLADPRLFGQIALSDPSKSSSVAKAFEMLIQEQMQLAIDRLKQKPGQMLSAEKIEEAGVREGWIKGLALIQRICANTRYFTDASTKIPLDVAKGDSAAGMCIDFYGRSSEEEVRKEDGTSRVGFIAPVGGTAISVDPIAMMRGAAEPELAEAFMEFALSDAGQKLWNFRPGSPGGPQKHALRRLPVRKDIYAPAHLEHMTDAKELPFEKAKAFTYHPEWTASSINIIAFLVRVMAVDSHHELRTAWEAVMKGGMNPRALEYMQQLQLINYDSVRTDIGPVLASRDKVKEVREARLLTDLFRRSYADAVKFSRAKR